MCKSSGFSDCKILDKLSEFKMNFSRVFVVLFYWFFKHRLHLPTSNLNGVHNYTRKIQDHTYHTILQENKGHGGSLCHLGFSRETTSGLHMYVCVYVYRDTYTHTHTHVELFQGTGLSDYGGSWQVWNL